jgi:hypothetical protein
MNANYYNVYSVIRVQLRTWTTNLQSTVQATSINQLLHSSVYSANKLWFVLIALCGSGSFPSYTLSPWNICVYKRLQVNWLHRVLQIA